MRLASPAEREKLIATIRNHLAARPDVLFAYLHGSFLAGGPYRDIDIAVFVDTQQIGAPRRRRYEADLAVELQLTLGQPVDVRLLNDAPLAFRYHATNGVPLVARDREARDEFRARTWDMYFDFLPFARRYLREVLGG